MPSVYAALNCYLVNEGSFASSVYAHMRMTLLKEHREGKSTVKECGSARVELRGHDELSTSESVCVVDRDGEHNRLTTVPVPRAINTQ